MGLKQAPAIIPVRALAFSRDIQFGEPPERETRFDFIAVVVIRVANAIALDMNERP